MIVLSPPKSMGPVLEQFPSNSSIKKRKQKTTHIQIHTLTRSHR